MRRVGLFARALSTSTVEAAKAAPKGRWKYFLGGVVAVPVVLAGAGASLFLYGSSKVQQQVDHVELMLREFADAFDEHSASKLEQAYEKHFAAVFRSASSLDKVIAVLRTCPLIPAKNRPTIADWTMSSFNWHTNNVYKWEGVVTLTDSSRYTVRFTRIADGLTQISWNLLEEAPSNDATLIDSFLSMMGVARTGKTDQDVFDSIDTNHDGFLSKEEIEAAIRKNSKIMSNDVRRIFDQIDVNHDGKISREEFQKASTRKL